MHFTSTAKTPTVKTWLADQKLLILIFSFRKEAELMFFSAALSVSATVQWTMWFKWLRYLIMQGAALLFHLPNLLRNKTGHLVN